MMPEPHDLDLTVEQYAALQDLLNGEVDPKVAVDLFGVTPADLAVGVVRYVLSREYGGDFQQVLGHFNLSAEQVFQAAREMDKETESPQAVGLLKDRIGKGWIIPSSLVQPESTGDARDAMNPYHSVPMKVRPAKIRPRRFRRLLPIIITLSIAACLFISWPFFLRYPESQWNNVSVTVPVQKKLPPLEIAVDGPVNHHLTSGQDASLIWTLDIHNAPEGEGSPPKVWLEVDESLKGIFKEADKYLQPRVVKDWKAGEKVTIHFSLPGEEPTPQDVPLVPLIQSGAVRLKGEFQNKSFSALTFLHVQQQPDVFVGRFPPPKPEAKVAVYMEDNVPLGSLCIVLDFSGSMIDKINGVAKIEHVRTAFEKVLDKIPADTQLSVLVFGASQNQLYQWVRPPTTWNATRQEKDFIHQRLGKGFLKPYGVSPVAEAILKAKEEGFPKNSNSKGPKIVLVLTDGFDTYFQKNFQEKGTPPKLIHDFLSKHFSTSDIEINMVCFSQNKEEAALARQQFDLIEKFEFPGIPGKFQQQPDPGKLAKTLEEMLRLQLRLYENNKLLPAFQQGRIVRPLTYNLEWEPALEIGSPKGKQFQATLQNTPSQNLTLLPGELMLLKATHGAGNKSIMLKRALFGELAERMKNPKDRTAKYTPDQGWLAAVLQNKIDNNQSRLTQLITLEKAEQGNHLYHQYPGFLWLEVSRENGKAPEGLHWYQEYGYPAPSFRLHAAKFFAKEKPKLSAWFQDSKSLANFGIPVALKDLKSGQVHSLFKSEIIIEKVAIQTRYVHTSPQKMELRDCLVIQMRHPPGQPVWLHVPRDQSQGEEHRFFIKAGYYEALFWGGNPPAEFRLLSLTQFKNQAHRFQWDIPQLIPGDTGPSITKLGSQN